MAERWSYYVVDRAEIPEADAFVADILAVYERHGLCIAHEDEHGSFIIQRERRETWHEALREAAWGDPRHKEGM